ncbi:hypothetical protein OfM1_05760 [Lactovum odontotermitis]
MRFFHRRKKPDNLVRHETIVDKSVKIEADWENVPAWVEVTGKEEVKTASLISSSIAMADRSDGKFTIKKVWQRNPEAELVSVLAAAVCTVTEENQLTVKSIKRKISSDRNA